MTRARRRATMVGILLPFLLTSCAAEHADPPPYDPSDDSSTAASKQPWEEQTPAGARAFVRHYINVLNESNNSLDTDEIKKITGKACRPCLASISSNEKLKANGGWQRGLTYTIDNLEYIPPAGTERNPRVSLKVSRGEIREKPSSDAKVLKDPATKLAFLYTIAWRSGKWVVIDRFTV